MKNGITELKLREDFIGEAGSVQRHFICSETDRLQRRIGEELTDILFTIT